MSSRFRLSLPRTLRLGRGAVEELPEVLAGPLRRIAVVGGSGNVAEDVARMLAQGGRVVSLFTRHGEPTLEGIESLTREVAGFGPDAVVGVGGGSAIDSAKAVAALVANQVHAAGEFFEVAGQPARSMEEPPLPVYAIPTTAGTGAEATANAVVTVGAAKVSLRDPRLVPEGAIVDADLGREVPGQVQVAAALDAVVQLIEAYATPLGNPLTRHCALGGARLGLEALPKIIAGSASDDDRQGMAIAATMSGIALANSKLGTIHGFAGVMGGRTGLAHGVLCGLFAGPVLDATIRELSNTAEGAAALARYRELAAIATGSPEAEPGDLGAWLADLVAAAGIEQPRLDPAAWDETITLVASASSTQGNPAALSYSQLTSILGGVVAKDGGYD